MKFIVFTLPTYILFTLKAFLEGRSFISFISMKRPRPPKLPPPAYPKERFYSQPTLHSISPTYRTP